MRTRFDQFAKQMTGIALAPGGTVRTDEEVSPETGHIDIWFTPFESAGAEVESAGVGEGDGRDGVFAMLGMLGRIARVPFTMEPFHRTPDGLEVMGVVCKHHYFRGLLVRRPEVVPAVVKRALVAPEGVAPEGVAAEDGNGKSGKGTVPLPVQWIVSSGRPGSALDGLRFDREAAAVWGPGVYEGPPLAFTRLVVVAELPETRDTLLMRLMGAGRVLERALEELRMLPMDAPERALALPLLVRLRIEIPADAAQRTKEDEEFIMTMQDTLERYNEQLDHRATARTLRETLVVIFRKRHAGLPEDVAQIIARTDDVERLRAWQELALERPADEVATAIRGGRSGATSTQS